MPEPKHAPRPEGHPPPKPGDVPPHILKELLELREKIGRLEGMMEVLLKQGK
jgi:hypothetical protein